MAKKVPVKAPLEEAKKPASEKSTLAKAKTAVVHAAEKVVDVVSQVAGAAKTHVAEAAGIVKKKKSRPARAEKLPPATPVPLPPRSTTAAGKMMSKNLSLPPKEKPTRGAKAKSKSKR